MSRDLQYPFDEPRATSLEPRPRPVRAGGATVVLLALALAAGCERSPRAKEPVAGNPIHSQTQDLLKLIDLPFTPVETRWVVDKQPGGGDWSLTAVLRLQEGDLQTWLKAQEGPLSAKAQRLPRDVLALMPAEVRARYPASAQGEFVEFLGYRVSADGFVNVQKSELTYGHVIALERDRILLLIMMTH